MSEPYQDINELPPSLNLSESVKTTHKGAILELLNNIGRLKNKSNDSADIKTLINYINDQAKIAGGSFEGGMKGGKSRKNKLIKSLRVIPKRKRLNKTKRNTTL
jgi:hypothetical protein